MYVCVRVIGYALPTGGFDWYSKYQVLVFISGMSAYLRANIDEDLNTFVNLH